MDNFIEKMINFQEWKLFRIFEKINKTFIIAASVIVFLLTIVTVVLRYILKISIFGLDEIIMLVIFYVYMFGASQGSLEDSQIRADMVSTIFHNRKVIEVCHTFARLVEACVLAVCFLWSVTYIGNDLRIVPTTTILKIPEIFTHITLLIGFLFMLIFSAAWFVRQCCVTIQVFKEGSAK